MQVKRRMFFYAGFELTCVSTMVVRNGSRNKIFSDFRGHNIKLKR